MVPGDGDDIAHTVRGMLPLVAGKRPALETTHDPVDDTPPSDNHGSDWDTDEGCVTLAGSEPVPGARQTIRRFRLTTTEGPISGKVLQSTVDRCSIGSHPLNDLVLDDPTVSRFHCEIRVDDKGAHIYDLNSRNGTLVDGVRVREAFLRGGSVLRLGRAAVRFEFGAERNPVSVSEATRFGSLVGSSIAMRTAFAMLERAAQSDATVLLEGETGTGKGKAAEAIYRNSARRDGPFLVVDCGAIPANLLESELFGHEKGAFTGADSRRVGGFEEASGGTVFLDEIGELPADLQPKLLRALEDREIRRLGSNRFRKVDVRVIAATNRDLRSEVNAGRFRPDLYFRLAVVKIPLPPLRDRVDDIPDLVREILRSLKAGPEAFDRMLAPHFVADLQRGAWPGNVRELRNHVERCLVFQDVGPMPAVERAADASPAQPVSAYAEARREALDAFEKSYLEALLRQCGGKVAQAASVAGVDRVYLYRLLRRHGMKPTP